MRKIKKILTESDRQADLIKRQQAIVESFGNEFNKIKRIDEMCSEPMEDEMTEVSNIPTGYEDPADMEQEHCYDEEGNEVECYDGGSDDEHYNPEEDLMQEDGEMWDRDAAHQDTTGDTSYEDNWEAGGGPDMEDESEFVDRDYRLIPQNGYLVLWNNDWNEEMDANDWTLAKDAVYDERGKRLDNGPQFPVTNPNTGEVENVIVFPPSKSEREDFGGM